MGASCRKAQRYSASEALRVLYNRINKTTGDGLDTGWIAKMEASLDSMPGIDSWVLDKELRLVADLWVSLHSNHAEDVVFTEAQIHRAAHTMVCVKGILVCASRKAINSDLPNRYLEALKVILSAVRWYPAPMIGLLEPCCAILAALLCTSRNLPNLQDQPGYEVVSDIRDLIQSLAAAMREHRHAAGFKILRFWTMDYWHLLRYRRTRPEKKETQPAWQELALLVWGPPEERGSAATNFTSSAFADLCGVTPPMAYLPTEDQTRAPLLTMSDFRTFRNYSHCVLKSKQAVLAFMRAEALHDIWGKAQFSAEALRGMRDAGFLQDAAKTRCFWLALPHLLPHIGLEPVPGPLAMWFACLESWREMRRKHAASLYDSRVYSYDDLEVPFQMFMAQAIATRDEGLAVDLLCSFPEEFLIGTTLAMQCGLPMTTKDFVVALAQTPQQGTCFRDVLLPQVLEHCAKLKVTAEALFAQEPAFQRELRVPGMGNAPNAVQVLAKAFESRRLHLAQVPDVYRTREVCVAACQFREGDFSHVPLAVFHDSAFQEAFPKFQVSGRSILDILKASQQKGLLQKSSGKSAFVEFPLQETDCSLNGSGGGGGGSSQPALAVPPPPDMREEDVKV